MAAICLPVRCLSCWGLSELDTIVNRPATRNDTSRFHSENLQNFDFAVSREQGDQRRFVSEHIDMAQLFNSLGLCPEASLRCYRNETRQHPQSFLCMLRTQPISNEPPVKSATYLCGHTLSSLHTDRAAGGNFQLAPFRHVVMIDVAEQQVPLAAML